MSIPAASGVVLVDFLIAYVAARAGYGTSTYWLIGLLRLGLAVLLWRSLSSAPRRATWHGLLIPGCGVATLLAVAAVIARGGWQIAPLVGLADSMLLYPVVEEIIYRGILLRALLTKWNAHPAVFATVLVFVLLHVGPYKGGVEPAALAIWSLIGLITALCFIKTRSVSACILLHWIINALLLSWQLLVGQL